MPWLHMEPIPGHPLQADLDASTLNFPARFAIAGDFDGDGIAELALAPEATGSAGNDFWVMKFHLSTGTWRHLSPLAGHPMQADIDFSTVNCAAKFAVAGDFDGSGRQQIAVALAAAGSPGNDFWVLKYEPVTRTWSHLSPLPGHPMQADIDITTLGFAAKFAVVGDFDGDGRQEIAIAPEAGGSAGNDFWVMKFDPVARRWSHLSPLPGNPMQADIDLTALNFAAKFAVTGDFDGDGRQEIAVAPIAAGSAGNDFWVMKYDPATRRWAHLSPIAGNPMQADIDFSTLNFVARFAVAGDFDGDGRQELAVAPETTGSAGNDLWVMRYDPAARRWTHLSPIAGHPMQADIDVSGLNYPVKFGVVGDFDGDGRAELALAPGAPASACNDFWVMRYNPQTRAWTHFSPLAGHPMQADFDVTTLNIPAKWAVAADFDGDRQAEIAVAPSASGSAGNDLWVMDFTTQQELRVSFQAQVTLLTDHGIPQLRGPFTRSLPLTLIFDRYRRIVRLEHLPPITVGPFETPVGRNTVTITLAGGVGGTFDQNLGDMTLPVTVHIDHSLPPALFSDIDLGFTLTTMAAISPNGTLRDTGARLDRPTARIALVAAGEFRGNYLDGTDFLLRAEGTLNPLP